MSTSKKKFSFIERYVSGETNAVTWGLVAKGLGIVNTFFILSSLTVYQYGVFQLLLQSYAFLAVFIGIGGSVVGNDIVRFIGEGKESHAKKLFWEYSRYRISIGVILWVITFFGASLFSFRFGGDAIDLIRITSFLFLYEALFRFIQPVLGARMKFFASSSRTAVNKGVQLIFLLTFFFFGHLGLTEVTLSYVIGAFVSTLSLIPPFLGAYKPWRGLPSAPERILSRIMVAYGKWELFAPFVNKGTSFLTTWLIKILISTEAVAIFNVAKSMIALVKGFTPTGSLSTLMALSITDKDRIEKSLIYGTKYLVLFSAGASVLALIFAPPLIGTFFPHYNAAIPFFSLMLLHMIFTSFGAVASIYLYVLRKQKFLFLRRLASDGLMIILYLLFIPLFGIWGLAFEYILNPFLMFLILVWYFVAIKPGIKIHWRKAVSFGREDVEFIKQMYEEGLLVMTKRVKSALRFG